MDYPLNGQWWPPAGATILWVKKKKHSSRICQLSRHVYFSKYLHPHTIAALCCPSVTPPANVTVSSTTVHYHSLLGWKHTGEFWARLMHARVTPKLASHWFQWAKTHGRYLFFPLAPIGAREKTMTCPFLDSDRTLMAHWNKVRENPCMKKNSVCFKYHYLAGSAANTDSLKIKKKMFR